MHWLEKCHLWIIPRSRVATPQYTIIQGTITPLPQTPEPPSKYNRFHDFPLQTRWISSVHRGRIVYSEIGAETLSSDIKFSDSNGTPSGNDRAVSSVGMVTEEEEPGEDCDEESLPDLM
ncbi:hypothetical protein MVEN_01146400 [Mycena venus]|uniref:Uncharacterized protein n=1 Tax=Mycena venus TaxID=2733690 RepID=A0A8H7CXJ3_9AGAR|nr:hypothetical protein MVEN_01146400 [Mycena venus]